MSKTKNTSFGSGKCYNDRTAIAPQVVFVTTELAPWSKTGGLADVIGALPAQLADRYFRALCMAKFALYCGLVAPMRPCIMAPHVENARPFLPGHKHMGMHMRVEVMFLVRKCAPFAPHADTRLPVC